MLTLDNMIAQGQSAYPKSLLASQVTKFYRNWQKGKLGSLPLEEAWQNKLNEHIAYWQDRYGLTDANQLAMMPGEWVATISWQISENSYQFAIQQKAQAKLIVSNNFADENMSLESRLQFAQERLAKLMASQYLTVPTNAISELVGSCHCFSEPKPMHDWYLWAKLIVDKAETIGLICKPRKLNQLIASYKHGESEANSLKELEEHIYMYACYAK